jgi:hypothetical protein
MKKSIFLFLVTLMVASLEAATYRVTPDAPGGGDGQSWATPMTIAEAIAAATTAEDIILCKAGEYTPTATIAISTAITFKGGLKGTDDETLAENGERSVFDTQNNSAITAIFSVTTTSGLNTFEGVEVRNAYFRGFNKSGAGSLSFKNCVFDSCGKNYKTSASSFTLRGGAGCFIGGGSATITFENCVFSRNMYELNETSNIGFGLAVAFQSWKGVTIDNSLFVSNGLGRACLKSTKNGSGVNNIRGAAIYSESPVTIRNTEFRANRAGISAALGGIVYVKDVSETSAFTNCLFLANSCEHCNTDITTAAAGVLVFRSKTKGILDVVNCTFAYNYTDSRNQVSAGIDIGTYISPGSQNAKANIKNTIFYGAKKNESLKGGKDINVASGCSANIDYCLFEENSTACISGAGTINKGQNNVFGDPKFVRAITAGEIASIMVNNDTYYGYSADAYETVFSKADVHGKSRKFVIDKGDPSSKYSNEPIPNGKRINLGYYGNTPGAIKTAAGMMVILR